MRMSELSLHTTAFACIPPSSIHSHLCKSAGNITMCYNPSELTAVIWLLMLSLYVLVCASRTVNNLYSHFHCRNWHQCRWLCYNNTAGWKKKKSLRPRLGMKISWSQLRADQVVMSGWMRKGSSITSSSVSQRGADSFISWGKLM